VLSAECGADAALVARFQQEARAAGALNHPNILSVLDVGVQEQVHFLVSELLEGQTLRARLRAGALPVSQAVDIAVQTLRGLAAAHEKGVVHRDLKPENLFLTHEGTVKILDFGLAKLCGSGEYPSVATEPGTLVGSVGYMSPEQVNGVEADQRSDVFAIGAILYEMLSGTRAFQGNSVVSVLNAILHDQPAELTSLDRGVPAELARVVERCLEKDPMRRFQSARDLAFQIERLAVEPTRDQPAPSLLQELKRRRVFRALVGYGIAAFAVLQIIEPVIHGLHWPEAMLSYVIVALGVGFPIVITLAWIFDVNAGRLERAPPAVRLRGGRLALTLIGIGVLAAAPGVLWHFVLRKSAPRAAARPASIAVLPFVNLSAEKENEYFSDGITEELINALANVEGVRVVARTSAFSFKGRNVNVRQVGEELNVATVLEGSVRRERNQLRVAAQLINAADGYHIWSNTYDREVKSVFSLEDELARAIVQALRPRLSTSTVVAPQTTNAEAYDLYLRGRYFWNQRFREGMIAKAMALFEQAVALDPNYALAYSGLADCYGLLVSWREVQGNKAGVRAVAAVDLLRKAKAHALKAVQLDDSLAEAHVSLGHALFLSDYDWSGAEREYRRAIELRPGYATAHYFYAVLLTNTGRQADARREAQEARLLDPTSVIINNAINSVLFHSRDFEGAIAQQMKTLELDPAASFARVWLVGAYLQLGRIADAWKALDDAPAQTPELQVVRAGMLGASGDKTTAHRMLEEIEARFAIPPGGRGLLALAFMLAGDNDRAFTWLERGIDERDNTVIGLKVNPAWDPIRSDPRYHRLLQRMNLE
jgi:adenylate cyclase